MTPEGIAFLKAITANPDDDLPRLVFADWLDEHGYPDRAEFVRLQIDRAGRGEEVPSDREAELLRRHAGEWLSLLPEGFRAGAEFRRGFLYRVECDAQVLFRPPVPVLLAPIEEMLVRVTDLNLEMDAVTPEPLTLPLRTLHIQCLQFVGYGLLDRLHKFGPFDTLRRLRIEDYTFGDEGARLLAADPSFPNVTELDLSNCGIYDPGAESLAESAWVQRLTVLRLTGNRISPGRLAWLRHRLGQAVVV